MVTQLPNRSVGRAKRVLRWSMVYVFPGLFLTLAFVIIVVSSRTPLSGNCPDVASLPPHVSLPEVYNNIPIQNVRWHFTDAFTGIFVVVGDADLRSIKVWVEKLKDDGISVNYGEIDTLTDVQVYSNNVNGTKPKLIGTISAQQYTEFWIGEDTIVILSRK